MPGLYARNLKQAKEKFRVKFNVKSAWNIGRKPVLLSSVKIVKSDKIEHGPGWTKGRGKHYWFTAKYK